MNHGSAPVYEDAHSERGVETAAFRRLLGAWSASMVGDGVRVAALPLYAAVSTHDPLAVSAVAAAEVLPWLLVALPAGALVDRFRARRVMMVAHLVRVLVTAALAAAVFLGTATVPVLVVIAFVLTTAETFADPASQRLLVELSGPKDLERGNGRFISVETTAMDVVGPLVAGVLFALHPALCFALDALSFVVAAVLVRTVPDAGPIAVARGGVRSALFGEVTEGGRYLVRDRGLRTLISVVVAAAVSVAAANTVMALYAVDVLDITPAAVPTLLIVMGLGTLIAARIVPAPVRRWGDGPVMVGAMVVLAGGFALIGAVQWAVTGWVAYALIGLGAGGWNILSATRRQRLTPPAMIGRVTSGFRVLTWGLMPIGAGLAGPVAAGTSLGTVYLLAAGLVLVTTLMFARPLITTGTRRTVDVATATSTPT